MTHKKLILMALMGVMLSDADAAPKKIASKALPSSRSRVMKSVNGPRDNVVTDAGGAQGGQGPSLFGDDTGTDTDLEKESGTKTQSNAPEAKVDEPLDLNVAENLTPGTKTLLHTSKDVMTRGELLEKVTGTSRENSSLRGQGNLLDAWAAIGEDDQAMGQYLATRDVVNVLNAFANKKRVDGVAAFTDAGNDANIEANWTVLPAEQAANRPAVTFSLLDNAAIAGRADAVESQLQAKYESFFDTLEKVKFATADGLVDFPEFSRAEMTIKDDVLAAVRGAAGNAANLLAVGGNQDQYARLMRPVEKAWKETATNAIKAVQKLATAEKEKGKTLFVPQLTGVDNQGAPTPLAAARTAVNQTWLPGSNTGGINGADGANPFKLKLVSVKPGEKRAFLKMDPLLVPTTDAAITGTTITAEGVVTENGVKLLKKMSDFYKKAKGKRAPFNPAAWQQNMSVFNVAEQKMIDAFDAEVAKKASGPDFEKARTKLQKMLNKKFADAQAVAALGGKFARAAQEDSEGV